MCGFYYFQFMEQLADFLTLVLSLVGLYFKKKPFDITIVIL